MAGYLGSKAVLLSTTAANVTGNASITGDLTVGTITSDALTVDNISVNGNTVASTTGSLVLEAAGTFTLDTNSVERLRVASNGDISFYEDTGTTPNFFWDASAESLGIGTSSPSQTLHVEASKASTDLVYFNNTNGTASDVLRLNTAGVGSGTTVFDAQSGGTTRFMVRGDGNVGIGTSSPSAPLDVVGSPGTLAEFRDGVSANFIVETSSNVTTIGNQAGSSILAFKSSNSEAMRIDSSGNLLVGKTSSSGLSAGAEMRSDGYAVITRDGDVPMQVRRLTDDGELIGFYKDGTTVGSIGTYSGNIYMVRGSISGVGIAGGGQFVATDSSGASSDNTRDLGTATVRWDDVYATNGTIQTSDANEKQDIDVLSDAEQRVAVAAKGLLRKFRWKSAVEEKGDDARIHFGIIAQDLQAAFEAEGLDAGDYAMFIHSTWTDEETGEEKSRMGVRYSELLAFIIGAM